MRGLPHIGGSPTVRQALTDSLDALAVAQLMDRSVERGRRRVTEHLGSGSDGPPNRPTRLEYPGRRTSCAATRVEKVAAKR
jgi:hypothetical protein